MTDNDDLLHEGVIRKSGRYPWGSGENPNQRNKTLLTYVDDMHKKGLTEKQIADGLGMTTTQLRVKKAILKNEQKKDAMYQAMKLKEKGMSNVAIGERMGINESSVRELLNPAAQEKSDILMTTASMLKEEIASKGMLDVGLGSEHHLLGVSNTKLNQALAILQEEGYRVDTVKVPQLGVAGNFTEVKVLSPPGTTYKDIVQNPDQIKVLGSYSEDAGRTFKKIEPPVHVDAKRVGVRYAEDGGADKDGLIEVRRGVDDVALGGSHYAQVRIGVGGTHYLKGMVMYSDDLPDGVDMVFNTNKSDTGNKLDAMKSIKDDPDLPFGSIVRQQMYVDKDGKEKQSVMNIVNDEADWEKWARNLSSQMLSKQTPDLAKQQLGLTFDQKKAEYDEIMALTNPAVKKKLLDSFAGGVDSSSVHLKAAALPRQKTHVILPINSLKENEIYAPNYRNGESVVLVRYPHGGTFEIPELTVNNRHPQAKQALGNAKAAVGINAKVAARLSGADFDGDTVLVIPNNNRQVRNSPALPGLKDFDPQMYKLPDDAPRMTGKAKQQKMGDVSNLITDMTIRGASNAELARAVKHSMVVIDAEKHHLDYKRSHQDNGIGELKKKYQGKANAGASTLISRASSQKRVEDRKARSAKQGGPVDPLTGKKVYEKTGESYVDKNGKTIVRKIKSTKMAETDDAHTLSSGTRMEEVYATHANKLKALADTARKSSLETPPVKYSPSAKVAYSSEVASLNAKLNRALKNKPLERQAQIVANTMVSAKRQADPTLEPSDIKKIKGVALTEARARVGASKEQIDITPTEWEAIQAGAISNNKLNQILTNTDLDLVKQYATPRDTPVMNKPTMARAQGMLAAGYTQSEVADALGIPTSTLSSSLTREES